MTFVSGSVYPTLCRMELAPTSGTTVKINAPFDHLWVTNGTTLAALTVTLPATPNDGDMVRISTTSAITALTFSPAVTGAAAGMAAGTGQTVEYSTPAGVWFVF